MNGKLPKNISGTLDMQGLCNNECDAFFSISDHHVTIIPMTDD